MGNRMGVGDDTHPRKSLAAEIAPVVAKIYELQSQAVQDYEPIVERIIRSASQNIREIEATLDNLLDVACEPDGLKLFRALCRYYYVIDPVATDHYVQSYRELWDDALEWTGVSGGKLVG